MRFTKMHGLGNDYIYVNCFEEAVDDAPALARAMSDRHTGVGSDGLILICPSQVAAARMEMYNADGLRGPMCGNGLRSVAKFVYDHGLLEARPEETQPAAGEAPWAKTLDHLSRALASSEAPDCTECDLVGMTLETDSGVLPAAVAARDGRAELLCIDVGRPRLEPAAIPSIIEADRIVDHPLTVAGQTYRVTCVCVGSSHAVIFVDDPDAVALEKVGPQLEYAREFPSRINVHFARVLSRDAVRIRTWERGSGVTLACGTGASATCVASVLAGLTERNVTVHMVGGSLRIAWDDDDHIYMTGPAIEVFTGHWAPK